MKYFRVFGSKCYIRREDKNLGKFDSRCDEGIFLGYSIKSKAYKCFNKRTCTIFESINVRVDERIGTREIDQDFEYQEGESCQEDFCEDSEEEAP